MGQASRVVRPSAFGFRRAYSCPTSGISYLGPSARLVALDVGVVANSGEGPARLGFDGRSTGGDERLALGFRDVHALCEECAQSLDGLGRGRALGESPGEVLAHGDEV